MKLEEVIEVDPEKLSGTPVFRGTRVPIRNLFDYLDGGDDLEQFLDEFPTVTREQAQAVLERPREDVNFVLGSAKVYNGDVEGS
jgi:uncharacterized protein (DUF433 family)